MRIPRLRTVRLPLALGLTAALLLVLASSGPLGAQGSGTVRGVVRDSVGNGIGGAQVMLAGRSQSAETARDGSFEMTRVPAGAQDLVIRRLGFVPGNRPVMVTASAALDVTIELTALATRLAPVIVRGRENIRGPMVGFYQRLDMAQGRFLTAEMIEQRRLTSMRELMRGIPGARVETVRGRLFVRMRGSTVPPMVFLDGVRMGAGESDLGLLDPRTFAGVEIYSGDATMPPEFKMGGLTGQSGGAVVIWTREGQARQRRPRRGEGSAATMVAELIAAQQVYAESEVDIPARQNPSTPVAPLYPDGMFGSGVEGSAVAEFVVDADGKVRTETINIVTASHPSFGDASRRALASAIFLPAQKNGILVAQVVQLSVRFTLPQPLDRSR